MKKALVSTALVAVLALSACGGGGGESGSGGEDGQAVTLSFWHNSSTGEGKAYWEETTKAFTEENPNVTFDIQTIQNEDMDGRLQTAMNAGDSPDIFMARGGGKLKDIVEAGQVKDLTGALSDETKSAYGDAVFKALTVDGKIYGVPVSILPGGIYYSKDLFAKAGIKDTPKTMEELSEVVEKLKAASIEPIALGAKDAWPAAHWYYFFALRNCSQETMAKATERDFSDECWLKSADDLKAFADTKPFNEGFLTTSAQQGAGSSAGMIANHKAAMELMGAWNPGVIQDLTPDGKPLPDLGWFPFPAVDGGKGDPSAMMGGADGFSCHADAPDVCVDFLNFVAKKEHQEGYSKAFNTLPASTEAQGVIEDPALQDILSSYNDTAYMITWLDTLLGQNVGNALNSGVVNMLAGQGAPADIVTAIEDAAAKG